MYIYIYIYIDVYIYLSIIYKCIVAVRAVRDVQLHRHPAVAYCNAFRAAGHEPAAGGHIDV